MLECRRLGPGPERDPWETTAVSIRAELMTKTTMRAARFDRAGRQLTVQDAAVPEPGPGEVLVPIEATRDLRVGPA